MPAPAAGPRDRAPAGIAQFLVFALVGAVGTATQYVVLVALVETALARPAPASVAGAICGALVNYALNRKHTFRSRRAHGRALAQFAVVVTLGIALNGLIVAWLAQGLGWHYLLAQVIATLVVLAWNFAGSKFWVFRE